MRRRFEAYKQQPKLVKLMGNLGVDQNYTIEKGYRYFDLLVVGGGGGGGTNSGGGGASGTIAFARNIKISLLPKTLTCKIAKPVNAQTDGDSTTLEINGDTIICAGGQRGNSEGAGGLGNGSKIPDSIYTILSKLVENPSSDIAICNNGGGSPGYWNGSYGYAGGSTENGLFAFLEKCVKDKIKVDNLYVISDMQVGDGKSVVWEKSSSYGYGKFAELLKGFKKVNPNCKIVSISIQGYGSEMFYRGSNILNIAGWSESIFDVINSKFCGYKNMIEKIKKIKI